jgi:hypothetical protein
MEKKWSTRVEHFSEALFISSPSTIVPCVIKGIIEAIEYLTCSFGHV